MVNFKIGSGSIELDSDTSVEMQRKSHFLQLDGDIIGDYSLPFGYMATDNNLVKMGYDPVMQKKITDAGRSVRMHDGNDYVSSGLVKIESIGHYINSLKKTPVSCYYLSSLAQFYQDVKGVKLRSVDLGGDHHFIWDHFDEGGAGFWGHIHTVLHSSPGYTVGPYQYAFYNLYDATWSFNDEGTDIPQVLNNTEYVSGTLKFKRNAINGMNGADSGATPNVIVPMPYLAYVMKQAAAYAGWRLQGDVLVSYDFLRITMTNFLGIEWGFTQSSGGDHVEGFPNIVFNLQWHMPDMTIGELFTNIKSRLGLFYEFDNARKIIYVRKVQTLLEGEVKDVTDKTILPVKKNISNTPTIYSFNMQESGFLSSRKGELVPESIQGQVDEVTDLPFASAGQDGKVYLVAGIGAYYICQMVDVEVYQWLFLRWHIYEVEPDGFTNTITTAALITGNDYLDSYYDFIPFYDQPGKRGVSGGRNPGPLLLLYWVGERSNKLGSKTAFATSGIYDSVLIPIAEMGLAWKAIKLDGTDIGVIATRYQPLFDLLSDTETFEVSLLLTKLEAMNIIFSDHLTINGVRMIISDLKPVYPFKGVLSATCIRRK